MYRQKRMAATVDSFSWKSLWQPFYALAATLRAQLNQQHFSIHETNCVVCAYVREIVYPNGLSSMSKIRYSKHPNFILGNIHYVIQ